MDDYRDDLFRERRSWREIDRRRDRSRHVGGDDLEPGQSPRWVRKQILREAERLFQGKRGPKMSPEQEKAKNEIHRTFGTKKFDPAIRKYMKEYGLPEDWSTLMLLLDSKDAGVALQALQALKDLYPNQGLEERQGFRSKLNIIAMTTKEEELRCRAEEVAAEI